MQLNLGIMRLRILRDLGEATEGNQRLTNPVLDDYVNQAYQDVSRDGNAFWRTTGDTEISTAYTAGPPEVLTKEYSLPDDMYSASEVRVGAGKTLTRIGLNELRAQFSTYQTDAAVAPTSITTVYFPRHRKIGLYPAPNAAGTPIYVTGWCVPTATSPAPTGSISTLILDTDIPEVDSQFHDMIVWRAVSRIAEFVIPDVEKAIERGAKAEEKYQSWLPRLQDYRNNALGMAAQPGTPATRR